MLHPGEREHELEYVMDREIFWRIHQYHPIRWANNEIKQEVQENGSIRR